MKEPELESGLVISEEALGLYNRSRNLPPTTPVCFAPFSSLYFNQKGDVSVCCWNHTYPIGRYPKQSVIEIWNGRKAENLRKRILQRDLSFGCDKCFGKLNMGDYQGIMASSYDRYSEAVHGAPHPRVLTFELSNTCNLACEMCWGHYSSKIRSVRDRLPAIPSPYDEAFLDQIVPLLPTVQEVRFVGGEPLLVPLYRKMLKAIAHHNPLIEVRITTNGTVVDHELEELMWGMNMSIHFSIDSFTPETYEGIRKGGTFSTVMSNFRRFVSLRDEGKIHMIGVSICPMRSNIHEIPSMLSLLNEMGIPAYFNNTTYPTFLSLRTLHPTLLNPIIRELEELQPIQDGDLGNQLQLEGLVTQLKGWSYLNGKLVSYGAQDLRDTLENRSDNVNKEVQRISLILIEIHIHTVFQVDDSEGFKAVRSKLDQLARNADEQISVELIDAIKLVAEVIGTLTGRNLHGQAVSFNRFLKDTPNAYRVLLSFIVRNDIIFMLHTLDDETIENMASFAVYDEKR